MATVREISATTGGKTYAVTDTAQIRGVFLDAMLQRECRPRCSDALDLTACGDIRPKCPHHVPRRRRMNTPRSARRSTPSTIPTNPNCQPTTKRPAWPRLAVKHTPACSVTRVLVVGASGAVGTIAVQLGVVFGATVTGVCSGAHADLVRSLGASDVVDYTREAFTDGSRRFDLIVDIGGRTPVSRLRRALTRTGTLVIVGGEGDRWIGGIQRQLWAGVLSAFVPQKLGAFVTKERAADLLTMNEFVTAGRVTPVLGPAFPLVDGAAAVAAFETGHPDGRIVITT